MSNKLIDLYRSILAAADLHADEDGYVSLHFSKDKKQPFLVKGKRLVLPTRTQLTSPNAKESVKFHPMSENILRGESDVLEALRSALNMRLNITIATLSLELLTLACSPGEHAKLSPEQSEFLSHVKNPDIRMVETLKKIQNVMPIAQTQKNFASIYLKRGGTVNGKKHARVGVVSFPLYQELKKGGDEVYGVKLRVKDRVALVQLLEYIIPGIDQPEAYNRGSDSQQAPFLDALMRAVLAVASPLNDVIERFRNQLEADPDSLVFPSDWVEAFDNLEAFRNEVRAIPMQAGNEGATKAAEPAQTGGVHPAPAPALAPAAAPAAPPVWAPPPIQQPTTPFMGQQSPPPFQQPVHTGRGLDFESLIRSNPVLSQQFNQSTAPSFSTGGAIAAHAAPPNWGRGASMGFGGQPSGWGSSGGFGFGGQPNQGYSSTFSGGGGGGFAGGGGGGFGQPRF